MSTLGVIEFGLAQQMLLWSVNNLIGSVVLLVNLLPGLAVFWVEDAESVIGRVRLLKE